MTRVYIIVGNAVTSTTLLAAVVLLQAVVVLSGFPATFTLEKAFPVNSRIELSELRKRDSLRHGRMMLQKDISPRGIIEFAAEGSYDAHVAGYTTIYTQLS